MTYSPHFTNKKTKILCHFPRSQDSTWKSWGSSENLLMPNTLYLLLRNTASSLCFLLWNFKYPYIASSYWGPHSLFREMNLEINISLGETVLTTLRNCSIWGDTSRAGSAGSHSFSSVKLRLLSSPPCSESGGANLLSAISREHAGFNTKLRPRSSKESLFDVKYCRLGDNDPLGRCRGNHTQRAITYSILFDPHTPTVTWAL